MIFMNQDKRPVANFMSIQTCPPEIAANYATLQQLAEVIGRVSDEEFVEVDDAFPNSSIGKHLRHICDFYRCYLTGTSSGRIDYDKRDRSQEIECRRLTALETVNALAREIEATAADLSAPVSVLAISEVGAPAEPCASTLRRELVFLQGHAIHHLAMIVMIMTRLGIETEPEWGVAPSTRDWYDGGQAS